MPLNKKKKKNTTNIVKCSKNSIINISIQHHSFVCMHLNGKKVLFHP